jgi:WD40 repeat protein
MHIGHEEIATYKGHEMWVNNALFLPDGRTIVSGGEDGYLKFWAVERGTGSSMLEYHSAVQAATLHDLMQEGTRNENDLRQDACEVRFCADGAKLAVLDDRPIIQVWDGTVEHALGVLPLPDEAAMTTVLLPDGLRAVSAGSDDKLRLWQLGAAQPPAVLGELDTPASRLAISPDGKRLAVGTVDGDVILWNTASWTAVATNFCGPGQITALKFYPAQNAVLAAVKVSDGTNALAKLDLHDGSVRFSSEHHPGIVTSLAFSPDSSLIAGASRDGDVRLWRADSLLLAATLRGHSGYVTSAAFAPDGRTLASASNDGTVKLWSVDGREELLTLPGHIAPWTQLAFSPDGAELAACGEAGLIRVWRATAARN